MFTPRDIRELETALGGDKLLELRRDWNTVLRGGANPPTLEKVAKQNECILKHACKVSNNLETRFVGRAQLLNKKSEWRKAVLDFADSDRCHENYSFSIYLDVGFLPTGAALKGFNFSHYFKTTGSRNNQKFKRANGEGSLKYPNVTGALGAYIAYRTKSGHSADVGIEVVAYASARTFHWWNISHELAYGQCVEQVPDGKLKPAGEDYSITKGQCKRKDKYTWVIDGTDGKGYVPKLQDILKDEYLKSPPTAPALDPVEEDDGDDDEEEDEEEDDEEEDEEEDDDDDYEEMLVGGYDDEDDEEEPGEADTPYINVIPRRHRGQDGGGRVLELHVVAADPTAKGIGRFVTLLLLNHFQTKKLDKRKSQAQQQAQPQAQTTPPPGESRKFIHVIMEQKIPDKTTNDGDFRGEVKCRIQVGAGSISASDWNKFKDYLAETEISTNRKVGTITKTERTGSNRYVFIKLESYGDKEKIKDWGGFTVKIGENDQQIKVTNTQWAKNIDKNERKPEIRYKWEKLLPNLKCASKAEPDWSPSFNDNIGTVPTRIGDFKPKETKYHHHIWWGMSRHSNVCDMVNVHTFTKETTRAARLAGRKRSCTNLNCTYTNEKCKLNDTAQDNAFLISPRDIVRVIRATQDPFNYFIEESGIAMMEEEEACKSKNENAYAVVVSLQTDCKAEDKCEWDVGNAKCRTTEVEEAKRDLRTRKMHKVKCR